MHQIGVRQSRGLNVERLNRVGREIRELRECVRHGVTDCQFDVFSERDGDIAPSNIELFPAAEDQSSHIKIGVTNRQSSQWPVFGKVESSSTLRARESRPFPFGLCILVVRVLVFTSHHFHRD